MNSRCLYILLTMSQLQTVIQSTVVGPWRRRRTVIIEEFSGFPKCIAGVIAEYCMIPKLLSWIDPNHIDYIPLQENPKAIESSMIDVQGRHDSFIAFNPEAAEYIKEHMDDFMSNDWIWANSALFDWLLESNSMDCIPFEELRYNPNPKAVKYVVDHAPEWLDYNNPGAFEYFRQKMSPEEISELYGNTAATDYLGDFAGHGDELSRNSHPRAIEYLRTHQDEIDWFRFSMNPGIFEYRIDPELVAALSE